LLAAIAAVALAGCGSSSLSSSELRAQATRVCSLANARTARIPTPAAPDGTVVFLKRGIAALRPELAGLRALHPPKDAAEVYSASLSAFAKKVTALKDTIHSIGGGEDPLLAMKALQAEVGPLESQEDGGWKALELSACLNT
jgi:hypothetical protein